MQLEVKLTGVVPTMAAADDDPGDHASMIAPGLAAPYHQHLFNVRLDIEVDGPDNEVYEVDTVPTGSPGSAENPWGSTLGADDDALGERAGCPAGDVDASRSRTWRIANRSCRNALGRPTAYKLLPGSTPTLLADPSSSVGILTPPLPPTTSGSKPFDPEEPIMPRGTTPISTQGAPGCRPGRRRIVRSSTPTSCCGTRSASRTSPGPRTGRSCRSSTPGSR